MRNLTSPLLAILLLSACQPETLAPPEEDAPPVTGGDGGSDPCSSTTHVMSVSEMPPDTNIEAFLERARTVTVPLIWVDGTSTTLTATLSFDTDRVTQVERVPVSGMGTCVDQWSIEGDIVATAADGSLSFQEHNSYISLPFDESRPIRLDETGDYTGTVLFGGGGLVEEWSSISPRPLPEGSEGGRYHIPIYWYSDGSVGGEAAVVLESYDPETGEQDRIPVATIADGRRE